MNIISTTVEHNGVPLKIESGKIYARAFGTTIHNQSMHWSWIEIKKEDLKPEVLKMLKEKNLV